MSRLRRSLAAAVAACALLTSGCAARFERPSAVAGGQQGGDQVYVDPGTGLPVPAGPGMTAGPGATTGPGGVPGSGGATGGPGSGGGSSSGTGSGGGTGGGSDGSGGSGGGSPVEPGSRDGVTDGGVKLCYLIPKTGAALVPPQVEQGIRAYWDNLRSRNTSIHGRYVTVDVYDTTSDESQARIVAQRAIDDDCFAVAALDRLGVQKSIAEYLDARKVPNIAIQAPVNMSSSLDWSFGATIDHGAQARMIAQYFKRRLGATKVAVVHERDATLRPGVGIFEDEAKRLGMAVFTTEIDGQGNDFSTQAAGVRGFGATAVWLYMAPVPARKFARQAEVNYHPTWFANSISWNFDLALVGDSTGDMRGARAFSPWPALNDPRTAAYQEAYRRLYADPPADLGIPGWGVGQIVSTALLNAGRDLGRNGFRHAMQNLRLSGRGPVDGTPLLWSPIAFGPGVRIGASLVCTYRENNGTWAMEADFRSAY